MNTTIIVFGQLSVRNKCYSLVMLFFFQPAIQMFICCLSHIYQHSRFFFFFFFSSPVLFMSIDAALPLLSSLFLFSVALDRSARVGHKQILSRERRKKKEGQRSWGSTKLTRLYVRVVSTNQREQDIPTNAIYFLTHLSLDYLSFPSSSFDFLIVLDLIDRPND